MVLAVGAFAAGNCDGAGNCYVANMASGTGSGADWTNACTDFTGACDVTSSSLRGTTLWVGGAPGNYYGAPYTAQNKTFSAPDSGTTPITIRAATAENHGTESGWRRQYATGIVLFSGPLLITTDYWIFDGQFRAHTQNATESQGGGCYHDQPFGYHMTVINSTGTANGAVQISGSNVTLRYIYVQGAGSTVVTTGGVYGTTNTDNGIYYSPGVKNEYLGYSWVAFTGADSVHASSGSNFIFEYDLFSKNHMGPPTLATQAISVGDLTNLIIRYNHFQEITGNAIIADDQADATAFTPNWYIYGNDVFWTNQLHTGSGYGLSGGFVNLMGETLNGGVIHVYNNTIAGMNVSACTSAQPCNSAALNLSGASGGSCAAHTQNCIGANAPVGTVYNNLWWDPYKAQNVLVNTAGNPQWTPTGDYGEAICLTTGCTNGGTFTAADPNDVVSNTGVITGGNPKGSPFKSFNAVMGSPIWYNFNFIVSANTAPGLSIPGWSSTPSGCNALNCESADPNYVTRGANGTIERGAFQINPRALLTVGTLNLAVGLHVGSTFPQVPVCTWSSAPTSDACPEGAAPFNKQWTSLDNAVATVNSSGTVTGVSPHNAFIRLYYGGLTNGNSSTVVVSDGQGTEPIATLPQGIVRTGSPLAFSGYDTTNYDANFPTTYSLPTGGKQWNPLNSTDLNTALQQSNPGDVIILQAGTQYTLPVTGGNNPFTYFLLPKKVNPNNKWIYIISSNIGSLPPQGTRVAPSDAVNMPQINNTTGNLAIVVDAGANHWWIAGVEIFSNPSGGGAHPIGGAAFGTNAPNPQTATLTMPDFITLDRVYVHAAQDMNHSITLNANHMAVLDSYIGPGRVYQTQGNAGANYFSAGPIKVINNFFSAFGEDFIFGGSGGFSNTWVNQDVYVHNNTFWKDPAWRVVGYTIPNNAPYEIVDNFEIKICSRCLIDGNLMQNSWLSAQAGGSVVFNTGTGVNGPDAVIDDITFSNNIITGTFQGGMGGTQFAAEDNGCGFYNSPCQYPGENRRSNYLNNLIIQGPQGAPGGRATLASATILTTIQRVMTDVLWQHNTYVGPYLTDYTYCDRAMYFSKVNSNDGATQNAWVLDNVMCRQMTGFDPSVGTTLLQHMMGDPTVVPYTTRFYGNVMQFFPSQGDKAQTWPKGSMDQSANFIYNSPTTGDFTLVTPVWNGANTSDGQQTGISYSTIMAHQHAPLGNCAISGTVGGAIFGGVAVSLTGRTTRTVYAQADGTYTFPNIASATYVVTPFWPGYTFSPASVTVTNQTCNVGGVNFNSTKSPTGTITGNVTAPAGGPFAQVTMNMSDTDKQSVQTDANGNYTLQNLLVPGSYVVTPVHAGFTFSPPNASVNINDPNSVNTLNFTSTATAVTYTISGTIGGQLAAGMVLNLSGTVSASTTADPTTGNYTFSSLPNGAYTVTPQKTGYVFNPAMTNVTINGANVANVNFQATQVLTFHTISGTVSGAIAAGVTLTLTGAAQATTTSAAGGTYSFPNLADGSYTVTPSLSGYKFSPTSLAVTVAGADVPGQNFNSVRIITGTTWNLVHIGPTVHTLVAPTKTPFKERPQ